ncbi:MAG: hypothetical protein M2R45_01702 [Verrucomicrobia subdivision 3 bacterium]|nr:hypothetical protein [Limisphaerales bacterium]MCS1413441.1 hypothetical protein [Limisphaerales bacterium]
MPHLTISEVFTGIAFAILVIICLLKFRYAPQPFSNTSTNAALRALIGQSTLRCYDSYNFTKPLTPYSFTHINNTDSKKTFQEGPLTTPSNAARKLLCPIFKATIQSYTVSYRHFRYAA